MNHDQKYYMKKWGLWKTVSAFLMVLHTYISSYNRFQLLETLPQRLRNGVCLFNGVTTIF
jgi:hypothetical protein